MYKEGFVVFERKSVPKNKDNSSEVQIKEVVIKNNDRADLTSAILNFSLAHMELTSYLTLKRVQDIGDKSANLASTSEETSATSQEVMASAEEANATIQSIADNMNKNDKELEDLNSMVYKVSDNLSNTVEKTNVLAKGVSNISSITSTISEIAEQTNLLSLNAMIESARAGESGRGFSVVAKEVRNLADKTKESVKNVSNISSSIENEVKGTESTLREVEKLFTNYFEGSLAYSKNVKESFENMKQASKMIDDIAVNITEQSKGAEEVANISVELNSSIDFGHIIKTNTDNLYNVAKGFGNISDNNNSIVSILSARLVDHADYLRKIISIGSNVKLTNHHQCNFGKWYDSNKNEYKNIAEFVELEKYHSSFHDAAADFVKIGSIESIEKLLESSTEILKHFIKLVNVFYKED